MHIESPHIKGIRRALIIATIAGLLILLYGVVAPFLTALAWAGILAYTMWPLHKRVMAWVPNRPWIAAMAMTLLITFGVAVPLGFIGLHIAGDVARLANHAQRILTGPEGEELATQLDRYSVGRPIANTLRDIRTSPETVQLYISENRGMIVGVVKGVLSGVSKNVFTLMVCLFTTYFLFLRGPAMSEQVRAALVRLGGDRTQELLRGTAETVRGVVYGLVFTAIAQAIVTAFGFWIAGVPYPILLGGLMLIMSFIPLGPVMVWLPAGLTMIAGGDWLWGIFVLIWGTGVISTMDNIFRPIFIGRATGMPVLLVFIGVVGGMLRFGLLGLFAGPVLLAIATSLWRAWIKPGAGFLPPIEPEPAPSSETPPAAS